MKLKIISLIFALICVSVVLAQTDKVYIIKFHYENEELTYVEKNLKFGYYPDSKFEPVEGHNLVIMSEEEQLYSSKFVIPLDLFVDHSSGSGISGGLVKLNSTDFAITIPYYEEGKEIIVYDKNNLEILKINIQDEQLAPASLRYVWIFSVLIFIAVLLLYFARWRHN